MATSENEFGKRATVRTWFMGFRASERADHATRGVPVFNHEYTVNVLEAAGAKDPRMPQHLVDSTPKLVCVVVPCAGARNLSQEKTSPLYSYLLERTGLGEPLAATRTVHF